MYNIVINKDSPVTFWLYLLNQNSIKTTPWLHWLDEFLCWGKRWKKVHLIVARSMNFKVALVSSNPSSLSYKSFDRVESHHYYRVMFRKYKEFPFCWSSFTGTYSKIWRCSPVEKMLALLILLVCETAQ